MKWYEIIKNKKLLSLLLLPTAVLATAAVIYFTTQSSKDYEQPKQNVLASLDDKSEDFLLSEAADATPADSGPFVEVEPESSSSPVPLLAGLKRDPKSPKWKKTKTLLDKEDTTIGTFFEKGRDPILLADNSIPLSLLPRTDETGTEGYETSQSTTSSGIGSLPPLTYLGPSTDGGSASGLNNSLIASSAIVALDDSVPGDGDPTNGTPPSTPDPNPIPEPATMILVGTGLIGIAALRRKFKK